MLTKHINMKSNCLTGKVQRMEFIDITKGIGILLVISSHIYGIFMSWALPFFIPVFFVVSGYCTNHPINIEAKLKKLIIPYFFFSFILLVIYHSFSFFDLIGVLYSRWCIYPLGCDNNIYMLCSGNGPLWFLTSMFVSFVLLWIIQRSRRPMALIIVFIVIAYLLSFLPILLPWSIDTSFLMVSFLYFGNIIRRMNLLDKIDIRLLCFLIVLYIAFWYNCSYVNLSVRIYGRSIFILVPAALLGSVLLIKLSYYIEGSFMGFIFSSIGRHSLSIFCIQMPFILLWRQLLGILQLNLSPALNGFFCILFVFLIVYPISLFLDKYVLRFITQ